MTEKKKKLMAQREVNTLAKHKGDYYGRGLALQLELTAMGEIVHATKELTAVQIVGKRATPNAGVD